MYICIDVGGTKTLITNIDEGGNITEETKIVTPQNYQEFLEQIKKAIDGFKSQDFNYCCVAIPVTGLDREKGIAKVFGNLQWRNVDIVNDLGKIINCPVLVENDAKLGGLYEAIDVKDQFSKVLYLTIGTGIGVSVINNLKIDLTAGDAGGSSILVNQNSGLVSWESLASGKAILRIYGKQAKNIDNDESWKEISKNLSLGLINLIGIFQPEIVIIGGGVGYYCDRFIDFLKKDLDDYNLTYITMPKLKKAKEATKAVVYGCYEYIKQHRNHE